MAKVTNWDGSETGTYYRFFDRDVSNAVVQDLRCNFLSCTGDSGWQNLVFDYHINKEHTCVLSVVKSIAMQCPDVRKLYARLVKDFKQVFKRDEIIPLLSEVATLARCEILLYVPEIDAWKSISVSNPDFRTKIQMTCDSLFFGWSSKRSSGPFGDLHVSSLQETYMNTAAAVLNEMYGASLSRTYGKFQIHLDSSRTKSEAAQRVLLHALQVAKLSSMFPYRVDKKKTFISHIEKYERIMNTLLNNRYQRIPNIELKYLASAKTDCVIVDKPELKEKAIEKAREKLETSLMEEEDKFQHALKKYYDNIRDIAYVRMAEVLREIKAMGNIKYHERLDRARWSSFNVEIHLSNKIKALTISRDVRYSWYMSRLNDFKKAHPMEDKAAKRELVRQFRETDPTCIEDKQFVERRRKEIREIQEYLDLYDPKMGPHQETVAELNWALRDEIDRLRRMSPEKIVTYNINEEYTQRENELAKLRKKYKKTREEAELMHDHIKYFKNPENQPVHTVERAKPHKGVRTYLKPTVPNVKYIYEDFNENMKKAERTVTKHIVEKKACPREKNRQLLVEEIEAAVSKPDLSVTRCFVRNEPLKGRQNLIRKITKIRAHRAKKAAGSIDRKDKWKGFKTQLPLENIPLEKEDMEKLRLTKMTISVGVRNLLESLRRSLLHSGRMPGTAEIAYNNDELYALFFIFKNKELHHYLRYFIPNSMASKFCAHKGRFYNNVFSSY